VQDELGTRAVVEVGSRGVELVAVVREIVPRPGEPPEPRCDECPEPDTGKPIRGLEIMRLAHGAVPGTWEGTVLDPEEGRRYRATAHLAECGRVLELRGYVLLPIFGRAERWQRLD
jgi:hypothetical protein